MIAMYCHLIKDGYNEQAAHYLCTFLPYLKKNLKRVSYSPQLMNFITQQAPAHKPLTYPKDEFAPDPQFLSIFSFNFVKEDVKWVDFEGFDSSLETISQLKDQDFAIDAEWRPYGKPKFSIMQLATSNKIVIFDMLRAKFADYRLVNAFTSLFRDPNTKKIFFGAEDDLALMVELIAKLSERDSKIEPLENKDCKTVIDLEPELIDLYPELKSKALKSFAEETFGKPLCKRNQCSNWNRRPLRESQKHYAAFDALVLFKLYEEVKKKVQNVKVYENFDDLAVERAEKRKDNAIRKQKIFQEKVAAKKEKKKQEAKDKADNKKIEAENENPSAQADAEEEKTES